MSGQTPQAASFSAPTRSDCDLMHSLRRMHGSCVSRDGHAVLAIGPPGSGKSDLVLRLLSRGFVLVADDQVDIVDGAVSCPAALAGLLEVRGLGIMRLPFCATSRLALIVELNAHPDRMPLPYQHPDLHLPVIRLDPAAPSAPEKVALALDCVIGRVTQIAGAFMP